MADILLDSAEDSSPESFDDELSQHHTSSAAQWQMQGQTSPSATSSSPSGLPHPISPMQKRRRRVSRACDECRKRKIKCDGKQPCTHCTIYSYDCTYDQPSNRRRNPAPQYIEALEKRLQRAEALLRTFIPGYDVKDAQFDALVRQRQAAAPGTAVKGETHLLDGEAQEDCSQDAQIRLMIASTGQLELDERGDWDFHGGSSGAVFLRRMRQEFGDLLGPETKAPFLPKPPRQKHTIESPRSANSPYCAGTSDTVDLPSKETALKLCYYALNRGCSLLRFVHGPSFLEMLDRVYDIDPKNFSNEESRFLPLLYIVLALGVLFVDDPQPTYEPEQAIYKTSIDQGLKYFRVGRSMMDITDCRDIVSLQAILFMILFLQSSSNLSTCYSYIGIALRSAIRMGLHRNLSGQFNPIERETRRRVFWVTRKMDTYVAALLGFPRLLNDEDIDQELPLEVDDEYITVEDILPMPKDKISVYSASNQHTSLMAILSNIIKYIYPIKAVEESIQSSSSPSYAVSHAKIAEIERDLQEWLDQLPVALRPSESGSEELVRVQQLLRIAYAHVQMMLYRPFLHYVSPKLSPPKSLDDRSYACAAACVSVSRNVIHITTEMKRRGLLMGAYWFTMYTTFFAIISLAFFVLENPDKNGTEDIMADAIAGKDALQSIAKKSMSADRCNNALNFLFEKLPEKLKRMNTEAKISRKRRSTAGVAHVVLGETKSVSGSKSNTSPDHNVRRSLTLPTPLQVTGESMHNASFDSPNFPKSAPADQPFQKNFPELLSPIDMSTAVAPDSITPNPLLQAQYNFGPGFGNSNGIPGLGAFMFPSADPFAYPNHSMTDFNNRQVKVEPMGDMLDSTSAMPTMYLSNGPSVSSPFDSLEGQLFGPLPPYLTQNPTNMNISVMDMNSMAGMDLREMRGHTGPTPGEGLNFDEIFGEVSNETWNPMTENQTYMQ